MIEDIDEEKMEEVRKKMKENKHLSSSSFMELGIELYYIEKQIDKFKEKGNEYRLEEAQEYKKKVKNEIESRMDKIAEQEKEMVE